jgi:hypothetical protein
LSPKRISIVSNYFCSSVDISLTIVIINDDEEHRAAIGTYIISRKEMERRGE